MGKGLLLKYPSLIPVLLVKQDVIEAYVIYCIGSFTTG